jgi:hypothetical protein
MSNDLHPNHPDYIRHDQQTGEVDEEVLVEVMDPISIGAVATLQRVEIDQQVTTAKAYPRNVTMIKKELTALVTMDEDTADDCIYALPRGQKHIKGPSARFADALISFWGNARSGAFITQVNREEKFVEAIGSFQDVERNVIRQRRVRRPIAGRDGRVYNNDMINMTGNAACVIAERNAILNGIPKSLWSGAYEQAFALVAGTTKTLGEKLERAEKAFALMGINMDQVLEKLGHKDISKVVPDDIVTMRGMLTALKTGEETVETIFGRGAGHQHETVSNPLKDDPKPANVESGGKTAAAQAQQAQQTPKNGVVESRGKKDDPISSGPVRSTAAAIAQAATVIDKDGIVVKSLHGELDTPIVDQRLPAGKQAFDNIDAWVAATEGLPEPEFRDEPAERSETASSQDENIKQADKASTGAAGAASGAKGTETPAKETNAQAAATKPATGDQKPYDDAESYMTFVRDGLDKARVKGTVTELWGSTRADRNNLLSPEQIDALTTDKENALKRIKAAEAK